MHDLIAVIAGLDCLETEFLAAMTDKAFAPPEHPRLGALAIAHHESGHIVAMRSFGSKIRWARIRPDGGGSVTYADAKPVELQTLEGGFRAEAWLVAAYCGAAAQLRYAGYVHPSVVESDFIGARMLGYRLGWSGDRLVEELSERRRRAAALVVRYWKEIELVAQVLAKKSKLSGQQIEALLDRSDRLIRPWGKPGVSGFVATPAGPAAGACFARSSPFESNCGTESRTFAQFSGCARSPPSPAYRRRLAMQGRRGLKLAPIELVRASLAADDRGALVWSRSAPAPIRIAAGKPARCGRMGALSCRFAVTAFYGRYAPSGGPGASIAALRMNISPSPSD
jgi:hypothetical protein